MMASIIDDNTISKFSLQEAFNALSEINIYIDHLEEKEPPGYDKEDHYYWHCDMNDVWYEKNLVTHRINTLLDAQLNEYFEGSYTQPWCKKEACNLLILKTL